MSSFYMSPHALTQGYDVGSDHGPPLSLDAWKRRSDLEEQPDFLIGSWLPAASRTIISAPTGVGKSNFAIALGMRIADGAPFLNWKGSDKPRRVLYIDGEMPRRLLRRRLLDEVERLGQPSGFHALSVQDFENFHPLNTKCGQADLIERIFPLIDPAVDCVIFDNVMSLLAGSMVDDQAWSEVVPLVKDLTRKGIAQVWIHHAGHDASRGYGTATRDWLMDNVIHGEHVRHEGADISLKLRFRKARDRTPETRADFDDVHVVLADDQWTVASAACRGHVAPKALQYLEALKCLASGPQGRTCGSRRGASCDDWKRATNHLGGDADNKQRASFSRCSRQLVEAGLVEQADDVAMVL